MTKKCKKLEEIKEMFKDNSIDISILTPYNVNITKDCTVSFYE